MPKVRTKTGKLTKGKTKPAVIAISSDTGTTDDYDDSSESGPVPVSNVRQDVIPSTSSGFAVPTVSKVAVTSGTQSLGKPAEPINVDEISDLIVDLKRGTQITYITKDVKHREFELNARQELLLMHNDLEMIKSTMNSSLNVTKKLCPDFIQGNVADAIRTLGFPKTFRDLMIGVVNAPTPAAHFRSGLATLPNPCEPIFEESEEDEIEALIKDTKISCTPYGTNTKTPTQTFPSPSKMAKYTTPQNSRIFQFGGNGYQAGTLLSTTKAPRLPKPGEVVYSQSGSPILQRRLPDDYIAKPFERVEVIGEDGSKIEVDMIFQGAQNATKLRGFKEFAKDVRGIAASRSTVKQNRVQPPKLAFKSQSATKKKPEWR